MRTTFVVLKCSYQHANCADKFLKCHFTYKTAIYSNLYMYLSALVCVSNKCYTLLLHKLSNILIINLFDSVKCSQADGNGSTVKRTTLHDLYERQGQSPWYDNLCRPVTDLLPLIESGVRGVTSNPAVNY